jgi:MacB-like periplasmic core domain
MRLLRKLRLRIRSLFLRATVDDELEAELSDYLEREQQAAMEQGGSITGARRLDVLSPTDQQRLKEECRDARGISRLDELLRDVRYGIRILRRNPAFSITAVVTLALGIGTASTLFSVVESQLWRPLPFSQPEKLMAIWERNVKQQQSDGTPVSSPDFADWRERNHTFESIAAMQWPERRNFAGQRFTQRPLVSGISAGFFETLRRPPLFGNSFTAANEHLGRQNEAILSATLAAQAFASPESSSWP